MPLFVPSDPCGRSLPPDLPAMRHRSRTRTGFTLIESLAAISIMALAGSVLLLAAQTSLDATDDAGKQAIAQGKGRQARVGCAPITS